MDSASCSLDLTGIDPLPYHEPVAWFFMLAADVGDDREAAEAFARYFDGRSLRFSDGFLCTLETVPFDKSLTQHVPNGPWCFRTIPSGLGTTGITADEQVRADEIQRWFYDLLLEAPDFRIADVGVEVVAHFEDGEVPDRVCRGMVVSQEIWEEMGKPGGMESFRRGYFWIPPWSTRLPA